MMLQSCYTMIIAFATIIVVLSRTLEGVNAKHPDSDKISSLPGQPAVTFQQYSGYVSVDDKNERALFYYFAEAEVDPASKPLVLWLEGGPACSSLGIGGFSEHGPFTSLDGHVLVKHDYSWNKVANMLYLDPAGVGFSYSTNTSFYDLVTDEITARDNLVFLQRWFTKFPMYTKNDFFITGESYGGHYVPQLAQLIVQTNTTFNFKGIAIGNPLLEFNTDLNSRAEFQWSHGLISDSTYQVLNTVCNYSRIYRQVYIENGNMTHDCADVYKLVMTEISNYTDTFDVTLDVCLHQQAHVQNRMQEKEKIDVCVEDKTTMYLNRKQVQDALHAKLVGVSNWSTCSNVVHYDWQNAEIPIIPVLGSLVKSGIRVLVYNGDQDSVIPLTSSRSLVDGLAKEIGLNTTVAYRAWFEGKQVAGWTQVYGDILSFATIRGAAHEAAFTQPARALVLLDAFLQGKPLPSIV